MAQTSFALVMPGIAASVALPLGVVGITRLRVRISAVVLTSGFALCGCAPQSPTPAAAAGSQATSSDVWRYAQTMTLDTTAAGANVPYDVENYPLAVLLDKSRFDFSQARANGVDIRFFDTGGKALPHAIELWDRSRALPRSGYCSIGSEATAGINRLS